MKKQLLINLIELRLLLSLFMLENTHTQSKIKDIIIILLQIDKENENLTNILNYNKDQLIYFCNENINNLLKNF